jgi:uncharacterized protein YlaI
MPKVKCSLCTKEMTIDEPGGEAYITEGLVISRDAEGIPISVDERNKTIRHVICPE